MHILNIYLGRKAILWVFFRHFVDLSAQNQPLWTTFGTLADWESNKERQLNYALEIAEPNPTRTNDIVQNLRSKHNTNQRRRSELKKQTQH